MHLLEFMMRQPVCCFVLPTPFRLWFACGFHWGFSICVNCKEKMVKNYSHLSVSSRQARSLAEDAFFHPSIMSVSYYSFEHCFAVYSVSYITARSFILNWVIKNSFSNSRDRGIYLHIEGTHARVFIFKSNICIDSFEKNICAEHLVLV